MIDSLPDSSYKNWLDFKIFYKSEKQVIRIKVLSGSKNEQKKNRHMGGFLFLFKNYYFV